MCFPFFLHLIFPLHHHRNRLKRAFSSIPFIYQLYKRAQNEKKNLDKERDGTAEDTRFFVKNGLKNDESTNGRGERGAGGGEGAPPFAQSPCGPGRNPLPPPSSRCCGR